MIFSRCLVDVTINLDGYFLSSVLCLDYPFLAGGPLFESRQFFLFSKEKKNINFELRICHNIKMKKLCYFGLRDNYFFDLMNWAVGRFFKNRFT